MLGFVADLVKQVDGDAFALFSGNSTRPTRLRQQGALSAARQPSLNRADDYVVPALLPKRGTPQQPPGRESTARPRRLTHGGRAVNRLLTVPMARWACCPVLPLGAIPRQPPGGTDPGG